jgi:hypothetical protein
MTFLVGEASTSSRCLPGHIEVLARLMTFLVGEASTSSRCLPGHIEVLGS